MDPDTIAVALSGRSAISLFDALQRPTCGRFEFVMPADHLIAPLEMFERALRASEAILAARPATLITFGIKPTYPATGFGYIKRGRELESEQGVAVFAVDRFI